MGEIVTSGYAIFADESENLCWRSAKIMISLKSMMKMPNVSVQKRQIVALLFKQEVSPRYVSIALYSERKAAKPQRLIIISESLSLCVQ